MENKKQERVLVLPLKKQWFDMIKSGEKKEEYREINDYWNKRLTYNIDELGPFLKHYDKIEFTLGYPRKDDKEKRMIFDCPKIRFGDGKPEWGAEPGKLYFVITWKRR